MRVSKLLGAALPALSLLGGAAFGAPPSVTLAATVWRAGQTGLLRASGEAAGAGVVVTCDGRPVWSGRLKPGPDGTQSVTLPVRAVGYYALAIGVGAPLNFAVVPAPPAGTRPLLLGVCTHFGQRAMPPQSFSVLKNLGIDMVRDELYWGKIEPKRGVYAFPPEYDAYMNGLASHGLKLFWIADAGSKLYGEYPPSSPAGSEAYGAYVVQVLRRYRSKINGVEVLNEPNSLNPVTQYLPLLQSAYRQEHKAGFVQPVIAGGGAGIGGGMNPDFASKVFAAGGSAFCDGFSQHPYTSPSPADLGYPIHDGDKLAANLDLALTRAQGLLRAYHKPGPRAWITEIGWPAPTAVPEPKQAAFIARTLLTASRYPVLRGLVTYDFQDDGPDPNNKENRFGLVRQDLTPKPAYQAYAIAADFLRGKRFVRAISPPDSPLWANVYRDGRGDLWVACWAPEYTQRAVDQAGLKVTPLPPDPWSVERRVRFTVGHAPGAHGFDWQGRPLAMPPSGALTASPRPLYIDTKLTRDTLTLVPTTGSGAKGR